MFRVTDADVQPLYVIRGATDTLVLDNAEEICRMNGDPTDAMRMSGSVIKIGKEKPRMIGVRCM